MRILIASNYFVPETVGAGIWVRELALELRGRGHEVTVLTSFPSYPEGRVFSAYRGRVLQREVIDGVTVVRTATFATASKGFWPRVLSFGVFCASAAAGGLLARLRADVVYAILPPLPLGVSASVLARACRAPLVVNVQDIYPDIAVATGVLRNRTAIRFFERMERWIYNRSARIVVISEGFRQRLLEKGVPSAKIAVQPNWADTDAIRPGARANGFRREIGVNGEFLVVYSGGMGHNSDLSSVLEAARILSSEPFAFAIVGEGVRKEALRAQAAALGLRNTRFLPFQPLARYPEVLASADATLVTLHSSATFASVPSKVYKQMAAARPIIAITEPGSELERLVADSRCGVTARPGDPVALAGVLRQAAASAEDFAAMGRRGREYLERECSRAASVAAIERVLAAAASGA